MARANQDKPRRYVIQHHWRGKNFHADLRFETGGGLATGWTLLTQIPKAVEAPVGSLDQARKLPMGGISKVDWLAGAWPTRGPAGSRSRSKIRAEPKGEFPATWLDVEGVTKKPEPGEPIPPGATPDHPGVFQIVDQGRLELGAQKSGFAEYFLTGGRNQYRLVFQRAELIAKQRHSYCRCMLCERPPEIDVLWADGRGRAWFCRACYAQWSETPRDEVSRKAIIGGNAPPEFADHHRTELGVLKQAAKVWLATAPEDLTPFVLSKEAVRQKWLPPAGASALPKAVRDQVPREYRYWEAGARGLRDALVSALGTGRVKIDFAAPYTVKKSKRFVLERQRELSGAESWALRLAISDPGFLVRTLGDPREGAQNAALIVDRNPYGPIVQGEVSAAHYRNPRKLERLEFIPEASGEVDVLVRSPEELTIGLLGRVFSLTPVDGSEVWQWTPQGESSPQEAEVQKQVEDLCSEKRFVPVLKVNKELRLVTGVVLEPEERDAHGDIESAEVIREAAHQYLARYNDRTRLGQMHKGFGDVGFELVESWVTHEATQIGDQKIKPGTWMITVKVTSDSVWSKVKRGIFTGFSIGGVATVRAA
jgi:hypothetical protein